MKDDASDIKATYPSSFSAASEGVRYKDYSMRVNDTSAAVATSIGSPFSSVGR